MGTVSKGVRVADRAVNTLLDVSAGEVVLVVADDASTAENQEIIDAMLGLARENGAEAELITMADVTEDVQTLPTAVEAALHEADVVIGITMTTAAPAVHHEVPERLKDEGRLRSMIMVKRSFEALTSPAVLQADYEEMAATADRLREVVETGSEIRLISDRGTDLTASIEGVSVGRTDVAHEPGGQTLASWGEVYMGPVVGSASGTAVVDGPVLGYDWPSEPVEVEIEDGAVVDVTGDPDVAPQLLEEIRSNENGENVAEIAFGINPHADLRETNIWKKGRGRTHIAVGSGLFYGQDVDSPIHVDLIMNDASVVVDGTTMIEDGDVVV